MDGKYAFALLGVACLCGAPCRAAGEPMEDERTGMALPEVVLQLKYAQGALDRIYLSQFRKPPGAPAAPAVPAARRLCADLCHAGLGGAACGATCTAMLPVGLATALRSDNQSSSQLGRPRAHVCPALCAYRLGAPLCECAARRDQGAGAVDWAAVCHAFCSDDGYVLGGCPACQNISIPMEPVAALSGRLLDTSEGWVAWCGVQCRQGHGGAACNCDRAPFQ